MEPITSTFEERLEVARSAVAAQKEQAEFDKTDSYQVGLYNGMEYALATAEGREPEYIQLVLPTEESVESVNIGDIESDPITLDIGDIEVDPKYFNEGE